MNPTGCLAKRLGQDKVLIGKGCLLRHCDMHKASGRHLCVPVQQGPSSGATQLLHQCLQQRQISRGYLCT